ncbi:MAG: thiol-disulfide oxidoreductase [Porticoccaceae bacterium]|nr:MAG: thiol-disulfide oxidoreductase [Porticoccaceae bacterium]
MRVPLAPQAEGQDPEPAAFFDGACPLCRSEISFWRRQPGAERIAFVDVERTDAALPRSVSRAQAPARSPIETALGEVVSGPAAFPALMATLSRLRRLARLGGRPCSRQLFKRFYGLFLRIQPALVAVYVYMRLWPGRSR